MKIQKIFFLIPLLIALSFSACSSDDDGQIEGGGDKDYTEVFIERLSTLIKDLIDLQSGSTYGEKAGMYPEASEELLVMEIDRLNTYLDKLKDGSSKVRPSDMDRIIDDANASIAAFKASVRTVDFIALPAELHVNGKNGGYIDFGSHPEYSKFGEEGKQAFTVELWIKFESFGSFDNILSTFIDGGDNPRQRRGWGINYYNEANNQLLRMTYTFGEYNLFEPGEKFSDAGEWIHLAMVANEPKTDDDDPHFFKMYINGNLVKAERDHNQVGNNLNYMPNDQPVSMLGFMYCNYDGSLGEFRKGTVGSMKHMHIWKEVKTQAEIRAIMDNPESVTVDSPNLVCGWTFDKTVSNEAAIKDITGKYRAKLMGDYTWNALQ